MTPKNHIEVEPPEDTEAKQRPPQLFKPGQSGNPAGRPRGSRNRIAGRFLDDVTEVWEEHGKEALITAIKREPMQFSKMEPEYCRHRSSRQPLPFLPRLTLRTWSKPEIS
jgi:hypothetical protein